MVESLKSAEVGLVAGYWTEQPTAEEEVPGLVRQKLNSQDCVRGLVHPVQVGGCLDHWEHST